MSQFRLIFLAVVLGAGGCKTVEAAGTKAANELQEGVQATSAERKKAEAATPAAVPSSPVLLRWQLGRYSLKLVKDASVEVKDQAGKLACEITEAGVVEHLGEKELEGLKAAIKTLSASKGQHARNPLFRAYDESRELVALEGGQEFLIELMYQAQEVIRPLPTADQEVFDDAMAKVMTVARNPKLCPSLGG